MNANVFYSAPPRFLPVWCALLLAIFGGVLTACAFVPIDWNGCVWIALLPLLTAIWSGPRRSGKKGAWLYAVYGWLFGVVAYGISFWWLNEVSTLGYILGISLYEALFPAIFAWLAGTFFHPNDIYQADYKLPKSDRIRLWKEWSLQDMLPTAVAAIGCGALWACLEWLRGWLVSGFGWNGYGVALYGSPLAQWAEYCGVSGLAFIPAVFNIWLWRTCRRAGAMVMNEGTRTVPWDFFGLVALLLGMFVIGSMWSAYYAPGAKAVSAQCELNIPIMTVQLNLSPYEKWDALDRTKNYQNLLDITCKGLIDLQYNALEQANDSGLETEFDMPSWIIWPESSFPIPTFHDAQTSQYFADQTNVDFLSVDNAYVQELRDMFGNFILISGVDNLYVNSSHKIVRAENCLAIFEGDYSTVKEQAKGVLVPFGEYIPFRETLPFLEKAFEFSSGTSMGLNYTPGLTTNPIPVPIRAGSTQTVSVIPLICFEDVVAERARAFVRPEPQIIINVTNDGWFNQSYVNEQHWRNAVFRCIELRRSMIRAANTGVSMAIAPNGAIIKDLRNEHGSPFIRDVMHATVPTAYTGVTAYALLGDWAISVCALIFVVFLTMRIYARNHKMFIAI